MANIERLKIAPLGVGGGPHWRADTQSLYVVDTLGSILQHHPKTGKTVINILGERVSFIIPAKERENEFIIGCNLSIYRIKWDIDANKIVSKDVLTNLPDELPTNRICDAKCDEKGRLWFGTLSEKFSEGANDGALYSYSENEGLKRHLSGIGLSNGIVFSQDNKKLYYIDSTTLKINQYDFDIIKGTVKLRRTVIDFKKANLGGMPHGMTADSTGKLWIACILASRVIQVDPDSGKVLKTVKFEKSKLITSLTFGGSYLDELYVTSANIPAYAEHSPEGGCTYKVTGLGVTGVLPNEFDLGH